VAHEHSRQQAVAVSQDCTGTLRSAGGSDRHFLTSCVEACLFETGFLFEAGVVLSKPTGKARGELFILGSFFLIVGGTHHKGLFSYGAKKDIGFIHAVEGKVFRRHKIVGACESKCVGYRPELAEGVDGRIGDRTIVGLEGLKRQNLRHSPVVAAPVIESARDIEEADGGAIDVDVCLSDVHPSSENFGRGELASAGLRGL
jgi:hypothetical protein